MKKFVVYNGKSKYHVQFIQENRPEHRPEFGAESDYTITEHELTPEEITQLQEEESRKVKADARAVRLATLTEIRKKPTITPNEIEQALKLMIDEIISTR
jgi:RecA/RadA recombinase